MNESENAALEDDPELVELVAYLDNELDDEQRLCIERRLADDEQYRLRMHSLDRAWDMLDSLPRSEASESFTNSTVEMVAVSAEEEIAKAEESGKRKNWLAWVIGISMVGAAAMIGFAAVDRALESPNERLVSDLPLVERLDVYMQTDDLEFIELLHDEDLFVEEPADEL